MGAVIQVENLSKFYKLGLIGGGTLRGDLERGWARLRGKPDPLLKIGEKDHGNQSGEYIWALRDVSFEVKQGEVLGIIGKNGAGKSTLLKILSHITAPTLGSVKIKGRIGALLEVGTGFHPELTGRENVFLNGAILGMTKAEVTRKFDEIVDFSGVEQFIDTPVKRYSSGMKVRLAFAVAAQLDPEILVIDEVLAVGDAEFQKKCLRKMGDVSKEGRTVLFVSHNMGAIRGLCDKSAWINAGRLREIGPTAEIISQYLDESRDKSMDMLKSHGILAIKKVILRRLDGSEVSQFKTGEGMIVEVHYHSREKIVKPYFWISVQGKYGSIFGCNMLFDAQRPEFIEGDGVLRCKIFNLPLLPNTYTIIMGSRDSGGQGFLIDSGPVAEFHILGTAKEIGFAGELADSIIPDSAPVILPYEWQLPDGGVRLVDVLQNNAKSITK